MEQHERSSDELEKRMKLTLLSLAAGLLLLTCAACAGAAPSDETTRLVNTLLRTAIAIYQGYTTGDQPDQGVITLTLDNPQRRLPIASEALPTADPVLQVQVIRIDNPTLTPFSVFAYLEWQPTTTQPARQVYTGSFTPFPADQTGVFTLSIGEALEELDIPIETEQAGSFFLVLELRPIPETDAQPSITVELRLADEAPNR